MTDGELCIAVACLFRLFRDMVNKDVELRMLSFNVYSVFQRSRGFIVYI